MTETQPETTVERHTRPAGALAIHADQEFWTERQQAALAQIGVDEATPGDLAVFLTYAQRTGLDPWTRQLYMIGRWDSRLGRKKWTIQASIDGLRIIAERTRRYAGQDAPEWCGEDGAWREVWTGQTPPIAARVRVYRHDWTRPAVGIAMFEEYAPRDRSGNLTGLWASKGALMLAKCAESLALRKAFPNDLSGIYTSEEMSQADVVRSEVVERERPAAPHASAPQGATVMAGPVEPEPSPRDAFDPDLTRAAILNARSRDGLKAALRHLGAITDEDGRERWANDRLAATVVADGAGEEIDAVTLVRRVAASLPATLPTDPDDDIVLDEPETVDA